jgi:hypothetical protein
VLNPASLETGSLQMPSYSPEPASCPSSITYSLTGAPCSCSYSSSGACWINCAPTTDTNINYGTTSCIAANTYSFTLNAVDSVSSLKNSTQTFKIALTQKAATAITMSNKPIDQTYTVGETAISIGAATYTTKPSCAPATFTYAVQSIDPEVSSGTLVTISGNQIVIETGDG